MNILENPKEAICMLLFDESLNVNSINEKLYGSDKRNSRISSRITELLDQGWIAPDHNYWRFHKQIKKDRRKTYYKFSSKCIIDSIETDLLLKGIKLRQIDRDKLENLFNEPIFHDYIKYVIKKEKQKIFLRDEKKEPIIDSFEPIKNEIGEFALFGYIFLSYTSKTIGIESKYFKKFAKKSFSQLLKIGITRDDLSKSIIKHTGLFADEVNIEDFSNRFEEVVYLFTNKGNNFLKTLTYLQKDNPGEFIAKSHLIMAIFDTIDSYTSNPKVQMAAKKLKRF